eukprot:109614-Amorphochlora_amoeboformis.AAC.1
MRVREGGFHALIVPYADTRQEQRSKDEIQRVHQSGIVDVPRALLKKFFCKAVYYISMRVTVLPLACVSVHITHGRYACLYAS